MRVWLVNPYGGLPDEGWRPYRCVLQAQALARAGHEVIWWTGAFEHRSKTWRCRDWEDRHPEPGFTVRLVPVPGYRRHVSLARIRFERAFARAFGERAKGELPPDAVVTWPALFDPDPLLQVVRASGAALVVDILDLWPELFHRRLPGPLAWAGRVLSIPLYGRRRRLVDAARGLSACTEDYLEVAAHRPELPRLHVPLGIDVARVQALRTQPPPRLEGLPPRREGEVWAIQAGTFGAAYDLDTLLDAAALLGRRDPPLRLLLAGEGPLGPRLRERVRREGLDRVHLLGRLDMDDLTRLYGACDLALATYAPGSTVSMPVKAFDYLAAGLPMVHGLGRELARLVATEDLGLAYRPGDARDLARALEALADDPGRRRAMGARALALAPRFDAAAQHARFVPFLSSLVSPPR